MSPEGAVLVIDDEKEVRESLVQLLGEEGYRVSSAPTAEEGLKKVNEGVFDLVLLDISLPDRNGLDVLKSLRRDTPDVGVIMITAFDSSQMAFQASKEGAASYVTKPWDNDKLLLEVRNALDKSRLQVENIQLRRALKRFGLPNIVGKSEKMQKVFDLITQVAASRATILITGESGTGKELVAKTIHATSPRADRTFVPVNTGSMPVDLLESTLFGHVKARSPRPAPPSAGSSKSPTRARSSSTRSARSEWRPSPSSCASSRSGNFMRLGGTETIRVDVRILAATNADLRRLVQENKFREDLFYRLNVIPLSLPSLRDRKEDIPALVEHFLRKFGEENKRTGLHFTPEALHVMMDYDWPGNVRELENAVERSVVLASAPELDPDLLPEQLSSNGSHENHPLPVEDFEGRSLFDIIGAYERRVILDMLARTKWSQTEAADKFKIPLSTLNQKIKRLQIDIKHHREN